MNDKLIRIASYNMRKARGLDQRRRPERTIEVINRLSADVVVLQEADKRLGQRPTALPRSMIETETDFNLVDVAQNDVSIGWHGNAVLVRKGLGARDVQGIDLPGLEPRGAVRLVLDIGTGLTVVATHLGLRRRDRYAQLAVLNMATADDAACVIAGDFNEWSATKGFEPLADRFETHSPGRSFHARRPIAGLDRFSLSQGLTLHDAGVDQSALASVASDHLPIWSDIELSASTY
ncbi:putative metal-dependent hydrolase [Sulfitobacter noctilucicola]|uniref:Endonuclease/exonuclease/phosphatase family metal-dependent hydrolase n=1 Tax=Sulfitobacter noctilucicola TaxID=1342301 RepID=A0A7W6Q270_9RHOB|nr:endonuclease/exonuclease/phosphatase family protein [Sulfitobacter noctilucicola]KIN62677.1 putative metal-dependent hydrolase [Sulfitobacter noctilucicola]MBB4172790.1 endonuclease/exonuclease/phosphatase family metal-dependent hydrolase [Sulfitobacter noctilucicola]